MVSALGGKWTLWSLAYWCLLEKLMARVFQLVVITVWLAGCSGEPATVNRHTNEAQASPAAFSLLGTSWTYPGADGETVLETIDTSGNYVSTVGEKVMDRGTVMMVGGEACFDSALSKAPPNCWQVSGVAVGETKEYVDNHGQRLRVTRVEHVAR